MSNDELKYFSSVEKLPKNCEIVYFWYSGNVDEGDLGIIDEAFENHDYKTFKKYYDKYSDDGFTFPRVADVFDEHGNIVGEIEIDNEEVIKALAYADYESG